MIWIIIHGLTRSRSRSYWQHLMNRWGLNVVSDFVLSRESQSNSPPLSITSLNNCTNKKTKSGVIFNLKLLNWASMKIRLKNHQYLNNSSESEEIPCLDIPILLILWLIGLQMLKLDCHHWYFMFPPVRCKVRSFLKGSKLELWIFLFSNDSWFKGSKLKLWILHVVVL
jgi:hypothetical protein